MSGYVSTIYDEKVRPKTAYPFELCAHLVQRFQISKKAKILDVGCGRGDFLEAFQAQGLEASGIDREPSAASVAPSVAVKYCDLEKDTFPFADGTFDVVFSKSVLEHLFNPEKFLLECKRILKPGGRIILMTPDWVSQMKIFFDDYSHRQPYTVTGVKDALEIFGFKETQAELFYQLPVLWRYPALKILSRILQWVVPVTTKSRIKFIRWSIELMVLGTGVK
jgi:2-polyprenyl-3-methyl-5-hydroxy-6-metoxy-1,4-benzoquinol methylase